MNGRVILLAVFAAMAAVLGPHLLLAVAAVVIAVAVAALAFGIAVIVADSGWRVQPCRRRFAC
jgi:hypothetical protein